LKLWFDVSNPFHANFFYPLIMELRREHDILITARKHGNTAQILEGKGLSHILVGRHGGGTPKGKLRAYAERTAKLTDLISKEKPDVLLTERDPSAVRVAFGLNIPAYTLFYDEREYFVNHMVFPLATKIFAPTFYTEQELSSQGVVHLDRVRWFHGFHTCYLKWCKIDARDNPLKEDDDDQVILVRPELEFASFFQGKADVLYETVKILSRRTDANIYVAPRTKSQEKAFSKLPVKIMNSALPENPVIYADVVAGAAETMLQEAFVIGVPAVCCAYWRMSKPMELLLKYINYSVNPTEVAKTIEDYLDKRRRNEFKEISQKIVSNMNNPLELILNELLGEVSKR